MIIKNGTGVYAGIVFGEIILLNEHENVKKYLVKDISAEKERFEKARLSACRKTEELIKKTNEQSGKNEAEIFEVHMMMLEDSDFIDSVNFKIERGINAEAAVFETGNEFAQKFSSLEDSYMKQRAADVKDISTRIIDALGSSKQIEKNDKTVIIIARDLTPSQTVGLIGKNVSGFITEEGSPTSHTAILARTMNIPAIVGVKGIVDNIYEGRKAAIDGSSGTFYIEPTENTVKRLVDKKERDDGERQLLQKFKGLETKTKKGRKVMLYANISNMADLDLVLANDAEGIGLFRSEFVFMQKKTYPTEDEQFEIYKNAVEKMNGRRVIIRTLDIGADKKIDYFDLPDEENPAMGLRAIRLCLERTDVFRIQLRAILRASAFGKAAIMFPMICTEDELKKARQILDDVKLELDFERIDYDRNIEVGIMVETPAAALISDKLAPLCDFFSIGTNDLTQYTLAVDRQNAHVNQNFDTHHEAILRLIKMTAENAHNEGIWVGICGELGSDTELTERFLNWGIDELSVSPVFILELRKNINMMDI